MSAVLIVIDEPRFCEAATGYLHSQGHRVTTADSLSTARRLLGNVRFDVLVTDLELPDGSGLSLLAQQTPDPTATLVPKVATVIVTGHSALKHRSQGPRGPNVTYLTKPVDMATLNACCNAPDQFPDSLRCRHFGEMVGESDAMRLIYDQIRQVAKTDSAVLIAGESGTGKELIARALHRESGRPGPLVAVNCGALSSGVVGSELFGHEKGAFTGADKRHRGAFERAADGTLFLDEVTEMPLEQQPLLLRTLENKSLLRIGSEQSVDINARIVSASNCDLELAMQRGTLRKDLYYRLNMFPIELPPLRDRMQDLDLLVASLVEDLNLEYGRAAVIQESQLSELQQWHWPGNIRELKHLLHRGFIATPADQTTLRLPSLPIDSGNAQENGSGRVSAPQSLRQRERDHILQVLRHQQGSRKRSAELLGVSAKTLYNRITEYQKAGDPEFLALLQAD